jgi:hypothetical protein
MCSDRGDYGDFFAFGLPREIFRDDPSSSNDHDCGGRS